MLRSFRLPSSKPSETRKRRSSACARARRTSPTWAASFRPTTSISPSAAPGEVTKTLAALKASPATAKAKAQVHPRDRRRDVRGRGPGSAARRSPAPIADFPDHFGFFLPLAGITTVKQIRESSFDIRATSRLNRLYVELLKDNPEWGTAERRHDMNHFMARLIFCFFAEDTDIFNGTGLFTATIEQMSARDSSNTHEVIGELFRAMNTKIEDRASRRATPLGRRVSLCEWRAVFGQHGRAALQQDRALLSSPYRQSRLDEDQSRHLRLDDPGGRGG